MEARKKKKRSLERELQKILELPSLKVSATAVRVPTFCGHGASVNVEFHEQMESIEKVRELLDAFPGLKVLDKPESEIYPTNIECIGSDYTLVGRLRRDRSVPSGINFWVVTDNASKGCRAQRFGNSRNPLQLPQHELTGFTWLNSRLHEYSAGHRILMV